MTRPAIPLRIFGLLLFVLLAGCAAGVIDAPPVVAAQSGTSKAADPPAAVPPPELAATVEPATSPAQDALKELETVGLPPPQEQPDPSASSGEDTLEIEPVAVATAAPTTTPESGIENTEEIDATPAGAVAAVTAPAADIAQPKEPQPSEKPAPVVAMIQEPTLDVASLKARLKATKGIGVFTKLALKNQVDDLLNQFKTHYQGGQTTDVAVLRQPYDMLVLKVLALVQDSDPPLARTISGSREAIWNILADQEKFKSAVT